ncbi:MAG: heme o synthase [Deltaproteobacteria bacterium]
MIAGSTAGAPVSVRDLIALTKPRLSGLVVITCGGAMMLAPGPSQPLRSWLGIIATSLVVGGANALNCHLERDLDRQMLRTRTRPLPAGRLDPRMGLIVGLALAAISLPLLAIVTNALTTALAAAALALYVLVYTPMKQRSPIALWVGGVPGAIPPLMGWTAVRGRIELPGLVLFAILFCWQIPHFIAIAIYGKEDYARAGHKILPLVVGPVAVKLHAAAWAAMLIPFTLMLAPLGLVRAWYFPVAAILGAVFLGWTLSGFAKHGDEADRIWARSTFRMSLVYLTALFVAIGASAR